MKMKCVQRSEILGLAEYEQIRPHFRDRLIAEKKERRLAVGPVMTVVFENRDTVLMQVQEMLRTERITKESAIDHEILTYNELVPADDELSFCLFIEISQKEEREAMLEKLEGLEDFVAIEVDGERFAASGKREGVEPGRTTAVHYLKVKLSKEGAAALRAGQGAAVFVVDHAGYSQRIPIAGVIKRQLQADLSWSS
jgi:hypothetical protein